MRIVTSVALCSALRCVNCIVLRTTVSTVVYQVVGYITSLGSVQVVGFFDVTARRCAGDRPLSALVGVSGHR